MKVIIHASEIVTGQGLIKKDGRHPQDEDLVIIKDGAIVYNEKKILWVGTTNALPKKYKKIKAKNLKNKQAIIPGLIDCHAHLIFGGDRSSEFAQRCGGVSYQQIAKAGGGIQKTVRETRNASLDDLVKAGSKRIESFYSRGVRTLEAKSGYGLDVETEIKILTAIQKLKKLHPEMTIVSTFLGAHDFPKDKTRDEYLREINDQMIPAVVKKKLASACDVFIDEGFYSPEEGRKILETAKKYGLQVKVHADELKNTESASLAVDVGALSADHLLCVSDKGIDKLAQSNTTAVLLPGTAFYLKAAQAPARKLFNAGARVAIASDFNPGTCMTTNLPAVLTISALYLGLTKAELFAAVTYNAACALGLENKKGALKAGYDSDFWVMPFERFEECYYQFAW